MALRDNIRNFLYPMTFEEMEREHEISVERGDTRRAMYVREFINECKAKDRAVQSLAENLDSVKKAIESDEPGVSYGTVEVDDELREDCSGDSSKDL